MDLRRIFLGAFLLLISSAVFAGSVTFTFDKPFAYQIWAATNSSGTNIVPATSPVLSGNSGAGTTVTFTYSTPPNYGIAFIYPINTEDYTFMKSKFDFSSPGGTYPVALFQKYRRSGYYGTTTYKHYELPAGFTSTCHATYVSEHFNSATKKLTVTVDNDLNPLQTISGTPIKYNGVKLHEATSLPQGDH